MKVKQADGTYRHVKRPKFPIMAAPDVVPGKLYLARSNGWSNAWHLARVQCVREPGWLRGHVNIRGFFTNGFGTYRAYTTIEPVIEGSNFDLLVERRTFKQPWTFVDDGNALLAEVPADYIQARLNELQRRASEHVAEVGRLEEKITLLGELA